MPKITAKFIRNEVKIPEKGQLLVRDSELMGFGLRITKGSMAYIAECRVNGRNVRKTICRCELMTPEEARKQARKILGEMLSGRSGKQEKIEVPTLTDVLEKFFKTRRLRASSVRHYRSVLQRCLGDWLEMPIDKISKEMVLQRHKELTRPTRQKTDGRAQANKALEILRLLLNFASDTYETANGEPVLLANPVATLNRNRSWHRAKVRQRIIPDSKLSLWYHEIMQLRQTTIRDYLLLLLLTGLRRMECATLRWKENIDFENRIITVGSDVTKNGMEHKLPMSDLIYQILRHRYEQQARTTKYVFPGRGGKSHLVDSTHVIAQIPHKIDCPFVLHDLRRCFLSRGERLGLSLFTLKRLANHSFGRDITTSYIILDVEADAKNY